MKLKKVLKILAIIISISILVFINTSKAKSKEEYKLQAIGASIELLKYKGETITSNYVGYAGKLYNYPAYCLDKNKKFITHELSYTVIENGEINEIMLWRYIVNGYPYKDLSELGCKQRDEAYVATQQAIYCYIYNQKIEDYEPIGEAGKRTLDAMKNIIENAQKEEGTPAEKAIKINEIEQEFKKDNIEENYASKTYEVTSSMPMESYKVILENIKEEDLSQFKITDINNNIKTEFQKDEKFKILLPIEKMKKEANFKITIQAKIQSKPIIYAIPTDDLYQDFAIPASITEEIVSKEHEEPYPENETSIKIIKLDKETKEKIQGAEFEILDSNKNIVYKNLKTNENGEILIKGIMPDTYYIKETKAKEGYILNSEPIKINIMLNQNIEVEFNNLKEKKPEIEIKEEKLPVTGM